MLCLLVSYCILLVLRMYGIVASGGDFIFSMNTAKIDYNLCEKPPSARVILKNADNANTSNGSVATAWVC